MPWLAAQAINALQTGDIDELRTLDRGAGGHLPAVVGDPRAGPHPRAQRRPARARERWPTRSTPASPPRRWPGTTGTIPANCSTACTRPSRALSDFAQNQFIYLTNIVNFIGPLVALTLLSRTSGAMAIAGYVVIAVVIVRFDRALMRLARAENDADRRYVAALLDFLGNASTVIGLRLSAASRAAAGPAHGSGLGAAQAHGGAERRQVVRGRPDGAGADLGPGGGLRLAVARAGPDGDAGRGVHDLPVRAAGRERGVVDGGQLPVLRAHAHRLRQRGADLAGAGARGRPGAGAHRSRCGLAHAAGRRTGLELHAARHRGCHRRRAAAACTRWRSRCAAASASRWSDPAAAARARCCACWPGSTRRRAARWRSTASPRPGRGCAPSPR